MRRTTTAALALALALVTGGAGVVGAAPSEGEDRLGLAPGAAGARAGCDAQTTAAPIDEETTPARVVGEVVAVDARAGVAMLSTAGGVFTLRATPETLAQLGIGDVVVVEFVDDDSPMPAASPLTCT